MCEEYESLHERMGRPVVMGQSSSSLVLSAIKTDVSLDSDDPGNKIFHCSNMKNELKSCQDSKFCMDAGFLNVVEIGQYFRTKNTADLSHFHAF